MENHCHIQEIKEATGLSRVTILRKLRASKCPFEKRNEPRRGKPRHCYRITGLPEEWQFRVRQLRANMLAQEMAADGAQDQEKLPVVLKTPAQLPEKRPSVFLNGIPKSKKDRALLSHRLVALYQEYIDMADTSYGLRMSRKHEFVRSYNAGENGIYAEIFKVLGRVTLDMLERWNRLLKDSNNDPYVLADSRGYHRSGATVVSQEQIDILIAVMLNPNRPTISEGIRLARKSWQERQIREGQHENTYRNAILKWKRNNYPQWVYAREGWKAFNEECLMHIDRDYSSIKVGDVVSADGHKFNLEILDPWSGKPRRMILVLFEDMKSGFPLGWCISRTENVSAIATAYYRACLMLGKVPKVVYCDNGKAFRKKVFSSIADFRQSSFVSLFERAGSKTIFAWPYHAESKTIERLFGSMAEFERLCPSYTGTSIDTKPARLKRNEKMHRKMHAILTGGSVPTVQEIGTALAKWFEDYVQRPQKGRLKGRSPMDVFDEGRASGPVLSERELFDLRSSLLPSESRIIRRDGIRMPWSDSHYWNPLLFGKKDHQVEVRFDPLDHSYILVFDQNGRFLCEARPRALVHPAAHMLGTKEDQEEAGRQIAEKRRQAKSVIGPVMKLFEAHILPEQRRMQERLGFLQCEPPKLLQPNQAAIPSRQNEPDETGYTDAEWREIEQKEALLNDHEDAAKREFKELLATSEIAARYDQALRLWTQGDTLTQDQLNLMNIYPESQEYKTYREHWEERKLNYEDCSEKACGNMTWNHAPT